MSSVIQDQSTVPASVQKPDISEALIELFAGAQKSAPKISEIWDGEDSSKRCLTAAPQTADRRKAAL